MKEEPKVPAAKNGKFFGYATMSQIHRHPSLSVYDADKAKVEEAKKIEAERQKKVAKEEAIVQAHEAASPKAVRKSPRRLQDD